jgi:hypothetical protein
LPYIQTLALRDKLLIIDDAYAPMHWLVYCGVVVAG